MYMYTTLVTKMYMYVGMCICYIIIVYVYTCVPRQHLLTIKLPGILVAPRD